MPAHAPHGRAPNATATANTPPAQSSAAPPAGPTVEDAVARSLARFDANDDGAISSAEMLAVVDPNGTRTTAAAKVTELFAAADANANGSLNGAEITAALAKLDTDGDGTLDRPATDATPPVAGLLLGGGPRGGGPGGHGGQGGHGSADVGGTVAELVDAMVLRFDTDASTTLALSELLAVLDPTGNHTTLAEKVSAAFTALDSNADASLSAAELSTVVAALDTDGDGTVNRADHVAHQFDDCTVSLIGVLLHDAPGHDFVG